MTDHPTYRLLDFGDGRKLEMLGDRVIDRPSPAAAGHRRQGHRRWASADSVFTSNSKRWEHANAWPDSLRIDCGDFIMPVRPTPFGHIGLFPEQANNWRWLGKSRPRIDGTDEPFASYGSRALNLFAYTGASTMALARAGFHVAHVDAARPNVDAARTAATANGLDQWPIRYLVDDAAKFAAREVRRGRRYHTVVMDPPSYGHGPKGDTWRIERDLWPLIDLVMKLVNPSEFRLLVTGHSAHVDASDVADYLRDGGPGRPFDRQFNGSSAKISTTRSQLVDASGRKLDAGFSVRMESVDRRDA